MKYHFLKSALSVVFLAAVGSALAIPPPPPPPTVNVHVQNKLATQYYNVTGVMGYCTSPNTKLLSPYGEVSYSASSYCSEASVTLTVQDKANNTCSASATPAQSPLSVTSNPNSSAGWACYADGSTLKVVSTISTKK